MWVNPNYIWYGVNSLRLGGLYMFLVSNSISYSVSWQINIGYCKEIRSCIVNRTCSLISSQNLCDVLCSYKIWFFLPIKHCRYMKVLKPYKAKWHNYVTSTFDIDFFTRKFTKPVLKLNCIYIGRPPSLSKLTTMIFNTGLTHLGSEASIYINK